MWIETAVLVLLALVPFLPALKGSACFDDMLLENDHIFDFDNSNITPKSRRQWAYQWGTWCYSPRRLTDLSFRWTVELFRMTYDRENRTITRYWAFHLVNQALHIANTLLFYALVGHWFSALQFGAAAIFAVHPLQAQSVAYVTGRAGLLSALFILLTMHLVLVGGVFSGLAGMLAGYLAVKSKESGIVVLPLALIVAAFK